MSDQARDRSVLVTGGTGFVGKAVCQELIRQGWRVTVTSRDSSTVAPAGVDVVQLGDLSEFHRGMDLSDYGAVVHLAAQVHLMRPTPEQSRRFETVNARATGELAMAAVSSGVGRFIFMSSVKVQGEATPLGEPLTEALPANADDAYGRSKACAEQLLVRAAEGSSMSWVILRPPLVYGGGVRANFQQLMRIARLPLPLPFRSLRNKRSFIFVGNLAHAVGYSLATDAMAGGTFLVRDGRDLSTGELIARIRKAGRRRWDPQLPIPTALLRGPMRLMGREQVAHRLTDSLQVDDSKIRRLGWRPPFTVDQGLELTSGRPQRPGRLLFVVTEDWYFCSHRLTLAKAARDAGWEVHVACRVKRHGEAIKAEGLFLHPLRLSRSGTNPVGELKALSELRRLYRKVDPDVAHHVAMKPVLYGGVVVRRRGGPQVVNAVAGMGSVFSGGRGSSRPKSAIMQMGLRHALRGEDRWLVVQNVDDLEFFRSRRLVAPERALIIAGSGVDTRLFVPGVTLREPPQATIQLTLVSRMLWDKGIGETVAAVRLLAERGHPIRLWLVGEPDPENPNSIDERQLEEWNDGHTVVWLGRRDDIPTVWARSDIAVLASYREGMPRSLLEAGASGLPLIATDVPGCRSLVEHGVTGLLVPPRDPAGLASALERLILDPDLRMSMGAAARRDILANYSDDTVMGQFLDLYDQISGKGDGGPCQVDLRESSPRTRVQPARSVRSSV